VRWAVLWGLAQRNLEGVTAIGVDEVLWRRWHKYLTLVYQLDEGCKRLLWIGRERTEQAFRGFFDMLGEVRSAAIRFVCSDMWKPYLDVVADKAGQALRVLDRFHIAANINKAVDEVRAKEAKALVKDGYEPVLKLARWCLLKRPGHLTDKQDVRWKPDPAPSRLHPLVCPFALSCLSPLHYRDLPELIEKVRMARTSS